MSLIKPFSGLRPTAGRAADVAAPPYDVLNTAEARERVAGKPWSFLHISKPEIDLPPGTDPHDPAVYRKGADNLRRMVDEGILQQDKQSHYYFYRLTMGEHIQTGLVAVVSVEAYDTNRIRKHEYTRPDKEDDRVRQIDALNAQTGPVFLTYRSSSVVDKIVGEVTSLPPEVDITADDGVRHCLWVVAEDRRIRVLTHTFDSMDCLYVADGHHRSAAGSRVGGMRKADSTGHTGEEGYNYFLAVIFPDNQMQILDYNRVVKDLNGFTSYEFLERVKERFQVMDSDAPVKPERRGEYGMYLSGKWYRLGINEQHVPVDDPVGKLDVSLLAEHLIEPLLGISDPRRDKRIDFVGGIRGLGELERRVNSGEMAVAFSLYPTNLDGLMDVADAGLVMPPKSTWFEPKLADGLVSHLLD
ncbi:MAG: DUF1015 domain-containing protein [Gammaproteobacteria bacterium]|nr:DUF1015 domain-containing protein [Gammaproteobacteria bacterium]